MDYFGEVLSRRAYSRLIGIVTMGIAIMAAASVGATETLNRGVVVRVNSDGQAYIGWRLLAEDHVNVGFNLYRTTGDGAPVRLNDQPITDSTNFTDREAPLDQNNSWQVIPVLNGEELANSGSATLPAGAPAGNLIEIKLDGDYAFDKVAIADLNGDGVYDYVIKQPSGGLDPGSARISPDSFKLEAYDGATGKFLWRHDMGWNMNMGTWWTPYVVADFNGDGRAEVALKSAPFAASFEESLAEKDGPARGFVISGPEYCTVLDGLTGEPVAQTDWIERGDPASWGDNKGNRVNRNQIGMARLDGERISLLVARGTYTKMFVDAYNLVDGELVKLWRWAGDDYDPPVRGQGCHGMTVYDFDGDGREEILLGSVMLDDDGTTMWCNYLGHPDYAYVADVLPGRAGLEIAYGYEDRQPEHGMQLADAQTGEMIWGMPESSRHIHDQGMLADIDPTVPGMELYGAERQRGDGQFLRAARTGELLHTRDMGGWAIVPLYFRDGPQKMITPFSWSMRGGELRDYSSGETVARYSGRIVAVADVLGDWREELITCNRGELHIYTTTIESTTRQVCLMQDSLYRNYVAHVSMGYLYPPQTSRSLFDE